MILLFYSVELMGHSRESLGQDGEEQENQEGEYITKAKGVSTQSYSEERSLLPSL